MDVIINFREIKKDYKGILWILYANKSDKFNEMGIFLEKLKWLELNQELDHLSRPITRREIELKIKNKEAKTTHKDKLRPSWLHCWTLLNI